MDGSWTGANASAFGYLPWAQSQPKSQSIYDDQQNCKRRPAALPPVEHVRHPARGDYTLWQKKQQQQQQVWQNTPLQGHPVGRDKRWRVPAPQPSALRQQHDDPHTSNTLPSYNFVDGAGIASTPIPLRERRLPSSYPPPLPPLNTANATSDGTKVARPQQAQPQQTHQTQQAYQTQQAQQPPVAPISQAGATAERLVDQLADRIRARPVTRGDVLAGGLDPCVPRSWVRTFNIVLGASALAILVGATRQFTSINGDNDPEIKREKMRIIGSTVSVVGALMWPVLWNQLAGYAVVVHHPLTLFAFLWPMAITGVDLVYSASARNPAEQARIFGLTELSTDANTLIGVAFAVGSLLASQANRRLADATVPLLMYSLLFLIAFIVPTPTLNPNDYSGFAAGAVQRVFFNYAMGLVIAGIAINISAQPDHGLQSALRSICLEKQTVGPSGDLDAEADASVRIDEARHHRHPQIHFGDNTPWLDGVLNCPRRS